MGRTHRLSARTCCAVTICVCFAPLFSVAGIPLRSASSEGSTSVRPQQQDGNERRVTPITPRTGPPAPNLPNLDEVKQRQVQAPRAAAALPSTIRSRRKPLESRSGRRVGDRLPPITRPTPRPMPSALPSPAPTPRHDELARFESPSRYFGNELGFRYLLAPFLPRGFVSPLSDSYAPLFASGNISFDVAPPPIPQVSDTKIVFASNREGSMQIYVMNGDGSGVARITNSLANDDFPRWSPNGSKILFQSDRHNPFSGIYDIYVMNADGSGVARLTSDANDDSMASWSSDGTKIGFQSLRNGTKYQVYSMNADGSNQVNLSNSPANDGEPAWSPDGTRIAFASDRDHDGVKNIYVMNSNGTDQQRLTFSSGNVHDGQPVWSPDGNRIAFVSTRDSTSETWQETDDFEIPEDDGQLISKSRLLVNKEIYVMNADGSAQTRLTNELSNDDSPSWSPDGARIIFYSDRERDDSDPMAQVCTMNADGTGPTNISNSPNGDYSASWTYGGVIDTPFGGGPRDNPPPVANPGGPYSAQSGELVQLNGSSSFDPNGTIVAYSWDFGDGTSGAGALVNHHYSAAGVYSVSLVVTDNSGNTASSQASVAVNSATLPAKINFDELPNNTVVANQYLNQYGVKFSSDNPVYPVRTWRNCGDCSTTSLPNYVWTGPNMPGITAQTIVEFTKPAGNLSFAIIGIDVFFDPFAVLDVYRNGAFYASYVARGNASTTIWANLGSLDNITKIVVRNITDPYGVGFDDFSFSIPADVKITSGRVSGYLNGTNQNALLGADIALNASPLPGGFSGGTYSWSFTGPYQVLTSTNSSSVTIRSTAVSSDAGVGPITATVSHTKNGVTATGSLTINSILPTVTSFSGQQIADTVTSLEFCGGNGWVWYRLACTPGTSPTLLQIEGIEFNARIHSPSSLSDPSQSGMKYVQAVSAFRKYHNMGARCVTKRSAETNVASGWQLDNRDPYATPSDSTHYFSEGNDLSLFAADSPGQALTGNYDYLFADSAYVDDRFEMYLVYFTGNAQQPSMQRPLAKVPWNWGGLVVFDPDGHHIRYSNSTPGTRPSQNTTFMVPMDGIRRGSDPEVVCPGDGPLSTNRIDSSRFFVRQHYLDFLGREPDVSGWDFWTSNISRCAFDQNCIRAERIHIGLAFFFSGEFIQTDPDMANPPGTPGFNAAIYNRRFVYWCYQKYLRRDPHDTQEDMEGWQFWTDDLNSNGNYGHIIDAFQVCDDYRNRPGFNLP